MSGEVAFWSYAHADNNAEKQRLTQLANDVREEYELLSGESLNLFVDSSEIGWGDEWRARIDTSLLSGSFFVPIVTPRYLKSVECRRELLSFYGAANALGFGRLILPIYYIDIPSFTEDSEDEVTAILARLQYEDWTSIRLRARDSHEYRQGVNKMAGRLVALSTEAPSERAPAQSRSAASPQGLFELVSEINTLLKPWLDAVESDPVGRAQQRAIFSTYEKRMSRQTGLQLALHHRLATDMRPLAENGLRLSRIYSSLTIELHPLVTAALRLSRAAPEAVRLLGPLRAAVNEAMTTVRDSAANEGQVASQYWSPLAKYGTTFDELAQIYTASDIYRDETNMTVLEWEAGIVELDAFLGAAQE